jgi:hypothetical protein
MIQKDKGPAESHLGKGLGADRAACLISPQHSHSEISVKSAARKQAERDWAAIWRPYQVVKMRTKPKPPTQ